MTIKVDNNCLNCSTSKQKELVTAFKLACLNYTSSKVEWANKEMEKISLIQIRDELLNNLIEIKNNAIEKIVIL